MKYTGKEESIINEAKQVVGRTTQMSIISDGAGVVLSYIKRIILKIIATFFSLFVWSLILLILLFPIIGLLFVVYKFFFSYLI